MRLCTSTCGLLLLSACGDLLDEPRAADPSTADLLLAVVEEMIDRVPEGRHPLAYATYVAPTDAGPIPEEVQRALSDAGVEIIRHGQPFSRDTTAAILGFVPPRKRDGHHFVHSDWFLPHEWGAEGQEYGFEVTCSGGRCRAELLTRGQANYGSGGTAFTHGGTAAPGCAQVPREPRHPGMTQPDEGQRVRALELVETRAYCGWIWDGASLPATSADGTIARVVEQVPRNEGSIDVSFEGGVAAAARRIDTMGGTAMIPSIPAFALLAGGSLLPGSAWGAGEACCPVTQVERYRAVLELEVGDLDGPLSLTRVNHIVPVGSRIYVSQLAEQRIRVLSAETGELLKELGGSGEGPGEFRRLAWIGAIEGRLTAFDQGLRRVTTFDADGEVAGTRRFALPAAERPVYFGGWFPTPDGHTIVLGDQGAFTGGERLETVPVLVVSGRGEVLLRLPDAQTGRRMITLRGDTGAMTMARPLHAGFRFAMAPDASLFVLTGSLDTETLTLFTYDPSVEKIDTIRTGLAHVPVPPPVADSITEHLRTTLLGPAPTGATLSGIDRTQLEEEIRLPDRVPVVDEIFIAPGGETWLREPNFGDGPDLWRVVASNGTLRAEVEVPRGFVLRARDGDHLWSSRVDPAFGVTSVQRLRLERVP